MGFAFREKHCDCFLHVQKKKKKAHSPHVKKSTASPHIKSIPCKTHSGMGFTAQQEFLRDTGSYFRIMRTTLSSIQVRWGCSLAGRVSDRVRFPGAARFFFFFFSPGVNFQSRFSYCVCAPPPPCAIACIYVCAHVKDPVQSMSEFGGL